MGCRVIYSSLEMPESIVEVGKWSLVDVEIGNAK
jgi:hypothetical protein